MTTGSDRGVLPPQSCIGRIRLRVADIGRSRSFYVDDLGLTEHDANDRAAAFGPAEGEALIRVEEVAGTRYRPDGINGLYHFAILFPDRASLASAIRRLQTARWPFHGFSDHGVSEAAYLADPDGNGIELYVDRPRDQWPTDSGRLVMYSRALDVPSLLEEAEPSNASSHLPAATRIGHMHLHVGDLAQAEAFWVDVVGFEVITRDYPGALFVSAGGYHHHLGVNTWARTRGRPADVAGLLDFEVRTGSETAVESVRGRAEHSGVSVTKTQDGLALKDMDGNVVLIRA
jgi:catechol 2,3-dioxygenase